MESKCPKCGAEVLLTYPCSVQYRCGSDYDDFGAVISTGRLCAFTQLSQVTAALDAAKKENAALTAEVERLRQSWTELRDAMVDMDRDCEDDLFENPSEALACCIELMDSIVTIEPKDRPDA